MEKFPKPLLKSFFLLFICISISYCDLFSTCRFHFGTDNGKASGTLMNEVDYLTAWAGTGEEFNMDSYFKNCKNNNKTPVIVSYILAFTARRDKGLQDCNVGTPDLCHEGANYIRQNGERILSQYTKYAKGAAASFGTTNYMVWCMEPDYTQYADSASQSGKGLSWAQAGALMNQMVDTIRKYCPKAVFSMDISPWKITSWQKGWFSNFKMSNFTYMNTSGGMSRADQTYIGDTWSKDCPTWAWVYQTYGTPVLADADYGTAGGSTGYDTRWDNVTNLTARIKDGVIGVSHYNPSSAATYASTIQSLRTQLPTPPKCPTGNTFIESKHSVHGNSAKDQLFSGVVELIDLKGRTVTQKKVEEIATVSVGREFLGIVIQPGAYFLRLHEKTGCAWLVTFSK
jgi:hypothetical protein